MDGCNISLTWIVLHAKWYFTPFIIGSSYERPIATLSSDRTCTVRGNSSVFCSMNIRDDWLIVVLSIFNVTAEQSGNYTLWKNTLFPEQIPYTSRNLVIIGQPTIMEVSKPVLGLRFQMTCNNTTFEQKPFLYRWRINDIERTIVYNVNSYTISSLGMNDTFSNVTCQVCWNQNTSIISCVTCQYDSCSIYSDPYTIQVIYGPVNVSLSREERHFYLKEHDIFAIDCFANCYPNCIFWWKGLDTIEGQKLNIFFEPRMSGQYACHVTNQQTNITIISDTITLHFAKEESRKLSQVCVQTQTEVLHTEHESHGIHLHIPSTKMRECKRTKKVACPKHSPEDNVRPKLQEDHYNTIDDQALSDEDLGMDLLIHNNSHEARNNEPIHYDYAHSIRIRHTETAFVHAADETSLTRSCDFGRPVELFQDEGNEVTDTDHSYLTVIDDSSHSVEVHQVKKLT
ncbi:hypothetical protein ACJMK2_026109 [Sinanodonta woodiana]|uniref:Ig-like domain-containing protein n=1 Tax=Sinanodonta woodiana TaxID=1069815 RepID=A0ABD3XII9_SINWO